MNLLRQARLIIGWVPAGKPSRYVTSDVGQPRRSTQPSTLRGMVNEYHLSGRMLINGDAERKRYSCLSIEAN